MRAWSAAVTVIIGIALGGCSLLVDAVPSESPPAGVGPATWALPPDHGIGPDMQEFVALVTERACASGRAADGRILGPAIDYRQDAVIVTFQVRGLDGAQGCPSNPSSPVRVHLDDPLGDRLLLDGGLGEPVEPPVCAAPPFCA